MTDKKYTVLAINPGSTSTKIGYFENEKEIFIEAVRHSTKELELYPNIWEQYSYRKKEILEKLADFNVDLTNVSAIVGRGGLIRPIASGVYTIDENMVNDARIGYQGTHASNLGCVIAYGIGWEYGVPSFIVDPPAVDDFESVARISGHAEVERNSLFHALNIFATARIYAKDIKKKIEDLNLIVAHLGGGITVAALRKGRAINVNNGLGEGPFSPERSGSMPLLQFADICLSGKYDKKQIKKFIAGKGGLVSYFGTNNAMDVEKMVKRGDERFRLVYEAMAYQIAEEIGARATNLKGNIDAIIITGGLAYSEMLISWITERVKFMAPVKVFPGENELQSLAAGALRVLKGEEKAKNYSLIHKKVGIIYWADIEIYRKSVENIKATFIESGYKLEKPDNSMQLFIHNCQEKRELVWEAIETCLNKNVDLICTIGTPASVAGCHYLKNSEIPVVAVGIYNPLVLGFIDINEKNNIYTSCYKVDIKEQLGNIINHLNPEVKKIGVLYRHGEIQSEIQYDELKKECQDRRLDLISYEIKSLEDVKKSYKFFVKEKVEWVIINTDTVTASASEEDLQKLVTTIPTLSCLENNIHNGALIGYIKPWKNVCQNGANLSINVINGNAGEGRSIIDNKNKLLINTKTAKTLKMLKTLQKKFPFAELV